MKPRWTAIVFCGVLLAWFFAPAVGGKSSFAYRDAAHDYHPLFEYTRQEWLSGRPPLWNPYENIGLPLAAQNTSSVFYPGKLLFALPLDYTLSYNWYVVLHVALAAAMSYALARHLRASVPGAALGAMSYAFGGNVLFAYSNVVFLVGAAWLPLAVLLADRMLRRRCARSAVTLGIVLALVILGGDPQMAYNAVLALALLACLLWLDERRGVRPAVNGGPTGWSRNRGALVAMALVVAGLLAAVQIVPTLEAAPHSQRARYDAPRNVYELGWSAIAGSDGDERLTWYDGLLGRVGQGHERQVYQFSVAPWRIVELVWPNVTGRAFPTDRRWLAALGVESGAWDLWTPTLYMGLLPVVLAAAAWSVRRTAPVETRFLSWMVVFGAVASLGIFGLGWAIGQFAGGADRLGVGEEVGGLYWWLTVLLPKYVYFRYPAKLFVVASLGLSMLAARGWDEAWQSGSGRVQRWLVALAVLGLAGLVATAVGWSYVEQRGAEAPPTPILGPFDATGARWDVVSALTQTTLMAVVLLAALRVGGGTSRWAGRARYGAIAITALDLAMAQGYLVSYAPAEDWQTRPKLLDTLAEGLADARVYRQPGVQAPSWRRSSSPERLAECVRWDRETLLPKYPLAYGVSMVEASETLAADDYRVLLEVAREHNARENKSPLVEPSILDLLGAGVAIVGDRARTDMSSAENLAEGMSAGLRPQSLGRAWIVHQVEVLPQFKSRSPARLKKFTEELLFPNGQPRDWRKMAVVETDEAIESPSELGAPSAAESCTIVRADPLCVEIDARLASAALVVLADLYYPGWELSVETDGQARPMTMLRTNRVMRGVLLPVGTHRLTYRYRPGSVFWGGMISGIAMLGLFAAAVVAGFCRRGSSRQI